MTILAELSANARVELRMSSRTRGDYTRTSNSAPSQRSAGRNRRIYQGLQAIPRLGPTIWLNTTVMVRIDH